MRWGPALFANGSLTLRRLWGLGGVAVTFCKVWRAPARPAPSPSATHGSIEGFKQAGFSEKTLLLTHSAHFWSAFTLCHSYSLHFHTPPLGFMHPIMHAERTAAQMFSDGVKKAQLCLENETNVGVNLGNESQTLQKGHKCSSLLILKESLPPPPPPPPPHSPHDRAAGGEWSHLELPSVAC